MARQVSIAISCQNFVFDNSFNGSHTMHYPSFFFRHHETFIPSLTRLDPCHFYTSQAWQACLKMTVVELIKLLILIKLYNNPHHIKRAKKGVWRMRNRTDFGAKYCMRGFFA